MPDCRTFPNQAIAGVGAVVVKDGQVLLVKRGKAPRKGEWSLPGGRVELGETTRDAIRREIQEETGLKTEVEGIIDTVDYIERTETGRVNFHYVLIDYLAYVHTGKLKAGSDAEDARFFTFDEALALPLWDETKRIIRAAQAMDQKVERQHEH